MIPQSASLWTCARSILQSNRTCLSLLSQNKQTSQSKPRASMFSRTTWLSWARAYSMAFQGNERDEKSGILSSNMEIAFSFPSWRGGKGLVMTFSLAVFSNCISLLSNEVLDLMPQLCAFVQSMPFSPKMVLTFLRWVKIGQRRTVFGFRKYWSH